MGSAFVTEVRGPADWDGGDGLLALVVRSEYRSGGVEFLTEPGEPQQVAFMAYAAGQAVAPHVHRSHGRTVSLTQEVLFVRTGSVWLDVFDYQRRNCGSFLLSAGDAAVLLRGGHGLRAVSDAQVFEVKTGPYAGSREADKETW